MPDKYWTGKNDGVGRYAYNQNMTRVEVSKFVRKHYPTERADRILARMENGADYTDAVNATATADPYLAGITKRWPGTTNGNSNTVAELAEMTKPLLITRANIDDLMDRRMIQTRMKNGNWWDIRRNGKTQTWKSQPGRIRIPYKYGFRGYGAITTWDFVDLRGSKLAEGSRDYCDLTFGVLDIGEYRVKPSL